MSLRDRLLPLLELPPVLPAAIARINCEIRFLPAAVAEGLPAERAEAAAYQIEALDHLLARGFGQYPGSTARIAMRVLGDRMAVQLQGDALGPAMVPLALRLIAGLLDVPYDPLMALTGARPMPIETVVARIRLTVAPAEAPTRAYGADAEGPMAAWLGLDPIPDEPWDVSPGTDTAPGTLLAGETLTFADLPMPGQETEFAILSVFDLFAAPGDIAQDEPEIFMSPEGLRITPVTMDRGFSRLLHEALRGR